jgi:hypothetical protein
MTAKHRDFLVHNCEQRHTDYECFPGGKPTADDGPLASPHGHKALPFYCLKFSGLQLIFFAYH